MPVNKDRELAIKHFAKYIKRTCKDCGYDVKKEEDTDAIIDILNEEIENLKVYVAGEFKIDLGQGH